ncbi:MAG TPA: alpha/beta fold hydrolase [Acidimicrobiales bacterium]|nr:alpha/beta fold hydrolase [Acidimicrobiales bacterium]
MGSTVWLEIMDTDLKRSVVPAAGWLTRTIESGKGEPLLLLHGTGGHAEAYLRNLAPLSRHFRVVIPDLAGHGFTTHATRDLEIADYVAHVIALMDQLDIARAHISGESLGGWVAARVAAQHPERVARMVLNTPGGTMMAAEVMERIRQLSQDAADDPSNERIRARLEWLMAEPTSVTDELVSIRQKIYARPGFATSMRHILCLQNPVVRERNLLTDDELARISAPTLVLWTSDDPSGPAAEGRSITARIPNAQFALIRGAGHWPQWEQAKRFNELHIAFLKGEAIE